MSTTATGVGTGVVRDADRAGRALRVSTHPEADRVVLSVWQDATCTATVRLDRAEVVELLAALGAALLPPTGSPGPAGLPDDERGA